MRIISTRYEDVPPAHQLTEAEIVGLCCENVPVDPCSEEGRVTVYSGADQSEIDTAAILDQARMENPGLRIIGVRIEDIGRPGKPCGHVRESWEGRNDCCDGVPALAWDTDITPDILPHGGSIIIAWTGSDGREVTVETSSNGTYFSDGRKTAIGHGSSIELFAGETFCGGTEITVTDNCSVARMSIRSDIGTWQLQPVPTCLFAGSYVPMPGYGEPGFYPTVHEITRGAYRMWESIVYQGWPGAVCPPVSDPSDVCAVRCAELAASPGSKIDTCFTWEHYVNADGYPQAPSPNGRVCECAPGYGVRMGASPCSSEIGWLLTSGGSYPKKDQWKNYKWVC